MVPACRWLTIQEGGKKCICLIMRQGKQKQTEGPPWQEAHGQDRMFVCLFVFSVGIVDFSEELKFEERRKGSSRSEGWKGRSRFKLQS